MNILGIDPGQSGGIARINSDGTAMAIKMPDTERDLWDNLYTGLLDAPRSTLCAYIEAVHAMPKQGISGVFKFGQNYGMFRAFLIALGIPFETVTPQKWQKVMGCLSHGDKNVTKRKAQELFPSLKITHAAADALLIAEYGRRLGLS